MELVKLTNNRISKRRNRNTNFEIEGKVNYCWRTSKLICNKKTIKNIINKCIEEDSFVRISQYNN